MIYKKDANFPYPLLTNNSLGYTDAEFYFDIELIENSEAYEFKLETTITSHFINQLLANQQAQLVFIIQAKDNKFYFLEHKKATIQIPKSRIALNKRTVLQMQIHANQAICFRDNTELAPIYQPYRDEIVVPKNGTLGYSNIVTFDSSTKKSYDLFEKKVDPNLLSEIKVMLSDETIVLVYRDEALQLAGVPNPIHNPYIYMGLRTALHQFIVLFAEEGEEAVILSELQAPEDGLNFKLYQLMKQKGVSELQVDTIDEVIYKISDHMMTKFVQTVRGLEGNAI
ncbi:MAG: hypothetical protein ACRC17_00630 [Culicoidibacterales bacterium]